MLSTLARADVARVERVRRDLPRGRRRRAVRRGAFHAEITPMRRRSSTKTRETTGERCRKIHAHLLRAIAVATARARRRKSRIDVARRFVDIYIGGVKHAADRARASFAPHHRARRPRRRRQRIARRPARACSRFRASRGVFTCVGRRGIRVDDGVARSSAQHRDGG